MISYLATIACIYLMMGAAFVFLIIANMPVVVEGVWGALWAVAIWPIVVWGTIGAGAMMFTVAVYIVLSHSLYRWML